MGHSYMGATSDFVVGGLLDCNTSPAPSWRLRPRVSRGAAISCIPFPRGPSTSPPSSQAPPPSLFLATSAPLPPPSPVHPIAIVYFVLLVVVVVIILERRKKKIRNDCPTMLRWWWWDHGRVWDRREARGKSREKLHPFESHLRTPSGLKKSIKRREARGRG